MPKLKDMDKKLNKTKRNKSFRIQKIQNIDSEMSGAHRTKVKGSNKPASTKVTKKSI